VLDDLVTRMQRLEALMRRTLTFTRLLELRISVVEPRALFDQVLRQLAPEIVKRGTRVTCDVGHGDLAVEGDRQLLEEVLTNLVTNALEALNSGGAIVLTAARRRKKIELAVDDDGPGVPAEISAKLFNPFTTSKPQGTGLGLAFCRKVIEEHGGTIEAVRSPRGGARFEIHLPVLS
jgi:signal transduction histidine kinase